MKARNCCKTMEAELTAWKANVYDIARKMESIIGDEREKILPNIEDLHILIAEMDDRIDQIRLPRAARFHPKQFEPIGQVIISNVPENVVESCHGGGNPHCRNLHLSTAIGQGLTKQKPASQSEPQCS